MQVLVVDDDEIVREMIAGNLEDEGYEVATAENGKVALEMLHTGSFRMVVSDWIMPGISGPQLCRAIRQRNHGRYIYVIVVTSRNSTDDIVAAFDAGADDFITKPVHPAELNVRLKVGERVLVFLTDWEDDGAPKVLGYVQGKSTIVEDGQGRTRLKGGSANGRTLESVAGELRYGPQHNIKLRPAN